MPNPWVKLGTFESRRKSRVRGLVFLIGMMIVLLSFPYGTATAVSGERDLIPLQPMIDRSAPGEVIVLASGRYSGPVTMDRNITIQGDPTVIVVNEEATSTITIRSDGVKLSGFTVEHDANEQTAAIQIEGKNSEITDLHIQTQGYGMIIRNSSQATIQRNNITWVGSDSATSSQKGNGIDLYNSHDSYIEGNEITGMRDGIYLENSRKSIVQNNRLLHTRYGIHCMYFDGSSVMDNTGEENMTGAMIMGVKNTVISGNSFRKQSTNVHSQGILLYDVHQSSIHNNVVEGNRVGMNIAESSGNEIRGNAVLRNFVGIQLVLAEANEFTRNRMVSNVIEASALDSPNNVLMENYWDSFQGLDLNRDGISEISYAINPFYEQLVSRNSAYQLFFQSPGMVFLSDLFTEGREQWTTDKAPRMSMDTGSDLNMSVERAAGSNVVWMLGLILLGIATFIIIYMGVLRK
ncbi:nitrous oxide reductase family maturation protein NosD [Paenibacillus sp. LS1]|uniref:right-handed parallel beta-helix repeat-containing protein n=1 Tax=Paenibacillus sp. LS1 TaxID=2992120 RepID=UPI002232C948|nr:NosD domain-containing protein [Paenibacillus sp. LS1]